MYIHVCVLQRVMEPESTEQEQEVTQPISEGGEPSEKKVETQEDVVRSKPTRTKVRSTNPAEGPDIAMEDSGLAAVEPITIGQMMKLTVSKVPDRPGLRYKSDTEWIDLTFQQYYDSAVAAAKSFLKVQLHVERLYITKGRPMGTQCFFSSTNMIAIWEHVFMYIHVQNLCTKHVHVRRCGPQNM